MHVLPVVSLPPLFGADDNPYDHSTFVTHYDAPVLPSMMTVTIAEPETHFVDRTQAGVQYVANWDSYVGQEPLKAELRVYIEESFATCAPVPHILLHSGNPGVGKTTIAKLIAQELETTMRTLAPPFSVQAINEAALAMRGFEVLFIDEIHRCEPKVLEALLTIMEEGVVYIGQEAHVLEEFTIVAATTDGDKLPETIIDRFEVKPFFESYSTADMVRIVKNFCNFFEVVLPAKTMVAIAKASRATPRVARELVKGAKALQTINERPVTPEELFEFKRVEPDGVTRAHKQYLKVLYGRRQIDASGAVSYRAGAETMMSILREGKTGIARIERYLMEQGLIDLTGRGRTLTPTGIAAAQRYLEQESR